MSFAAGGSSGGGGTISGPTSSNPYTPRRSSAPTGTAPRYAPGNPAGELVYGMGGDGLYLPGSTPTTSSYGSSGTPQTNPDGTPYVPGYYHDAATGAYLPVQASSQPGGSGNGVMQSFTNNAPQDKNFQWLIDQMKSRTTGPGASNAAITQMGQRLREFGAGQAQARAGDLARRGLLQGGAGSAGSLSAVDTDRLNSQFAQNAAGIALGRQGQIDQLLSGMTNPISQSGQQNLAERQFGLNQYQTQANLDLQRQALQQQAQSQAWQQQLAAQQAMMAQQQMMMNAYNSLYR